MKERPILFSAPMVRAILSGSKSQTRRVVKPQPIADTRFVGGYYVTEPKFTESSNISVEAPYVHLACPHGQPGDRLWVRETWRHTAHDLDEARRITEDIMSGTAVDYAATYIDNCMRELGFSRDDAEMAFDFEEWRHHSKMPRWASRILLEVTAVRVERLQDIGEDDARAEGVDALPIETGHATPKTNFQFLWESINGPGSWDANPWVWVVEFKRVTP